jgi:hypothetical protein
LRIITTVVKLDSCTFYIKIWIWPFLDRITGYAISSSLQSTKGGISSFSDLSLSDSTSPSSLVSITLRFGHWDAMCPFPKHLKHFQENPRSERNCNIGPNRLYKFCYLLPFDLWTSYLARILFLQGCGSLFWEFPSSTRIFNELQYNLQVLQGFINVSESFSYKDSLLILATQGKKGRWYLMTS